MIAPSIIAIVYGTVGSIVELFLAGAMPGVMVAADLMPYSHLFARQVCASSGRLLSRGTTDRPPGSMPP